jgi:hypothetical protein
VAVFPRLPDDDGIDGVVCPLWRPFPPLARPGYWRLGVRSRRMRLERGVVVPLPPLRLFLGRRTALGNEGVAVLVAGIVLVGDVGIEEVEGGRLGGRRAGGRGGRLGSVEAGRWRTSATLPELRATRGDAREGVTRVGGRRVLTEGVSVARRCSIVLAGVLCAVFDGEIRETRTRARAL